MFPLPAAGRIGLYVLLLLAGVVALYLGKAVIATLLISLLLASVLGPAATWLHQTLKIRWGLSCIIVVLGLVLANLLITTVFAAAITRMVQRVPNPNNEREFIQQYDIFRAKLEQVWPFSLDEGQFPKNPQNVDDIRSVKWMTELATDYLRNSWNYPANWLLYWILVLFITFFVLLEGKMLARRVVAIFGPSPEVQARATSVLLDMAQSVRTYLVWRTIINLGLAIVMGLIYQTAGLSQAWTWAILLAILNYVPYLGPVVAGIPPFLDAFISASPAAAVVVTIVYLGVIVLEGYLIVPLLMGHNMDLNATTVMVACLFWELVWGTTGLFLAMPIMAGIKAILFNVPEWRPWADLMSSGDRPAEEPPPVAVIAPAPSDSPNGKSGGSHAEPRFTTDEPPRADGHL